jgi:hypothetical protein
MVVLARNVAGMVVLLESKRDARMLCSLFRSPWSASRQFRQEAEIVERLGARAASSLLAGRAVVRVSGRLIRDD